MIVTTVQCDLLVSVRRFLLLGVFFFSFLSVYGQTSITPGGEASGSSGQVSYTVGQVSCETKISTDGSVSEGVQQPFEIFVVSKEEAKDIDLSIASFPNPVENQLKLSIIKNSSPLLDISYRLMDLSGKIVEKKQINAPETLIDMSDLSSGVYFLEVFKQNIQVKVFKIIKR